MGVPVCRQCGRLLLRQAETPLFCLPETPDLVDNREFRGGVPEWLKGADCKSVGLAPTLVRIQPSPPGLKAVEIGPRGGCSSMVEQKPSKLTTRVRFPSPAPEGSSRAHVAQW